MAQDSSTANALAKVVLGSLSDEKPKTTDEILDHLKDSTNVLATQDDVRRCLDALWERGMVAIRDHIKYMITTEGSKMLSEGSDPMMSASIKNPWEYDGYNPGITKDRWASLIADPYIFDDRSKLMVRQFMQFDEGATCTMVAERFGGEASQYLGRANGLAKRIHKATGCPLYTDESGKARYWPVIFRGRCPENDVPGVFIWDLRPELKEALIMSEEGIETDSEKQTESFFDYLSEKGLSYSTRTVENFLLSLKAKQFVILSGGTGNGKTGLVKAYGEFISERKDPLKMQIPVSLKKCISNRGFTLSTDSFFSYLPPEARSYDGNYRFSLAGAEGNCRIAMTPRFWFTWDDEMKGVERAVEEKKKDGDDATLTIWRDGSSSDSRYLIVPVGSNWTDGKHIIGYLNAISGKYSSTPALEFMAESNRDPLSPYLLILDEMNLSHVEHYLSDFLSCIESREPIKIGRGDDGNVPDRLLMRDNLFLVGTVNMDETTHMFSPKVLDRANVVEFGAASVGGYVSKEPLGYAPSGDVGFLEDCMAGLECRSMGAREIFEAICSVNTNKDVVKSIVDCLDSIQACMGSMRMPFGYRTIDEIFRFLYVSWIYEGKGEFAGWRRYLDTQIKQKILPKIHGNLSIADGLTKLRDLCASSGFTESAEKLTRMSEVLSSQRYVTFNC